MDDPEFLAVGVPKFITELLPSILVLGKFGFKPTQTQFEPNRNRVSGFRFGFWFQPFQFSQMVSNLV